MELNTDFSELLASFVAHEVEFLVVGGYALAHHGAPRMTGDIDLFVHPTEANAGKILAALDEFGFGSLDLTIPDFTGADHVVQLGMPPVRIDILTSLDGVTWEQAQADRESFQVGDLSVPVIGRHSLIANKRASARAQDLADLDALGA